MKSYHIPKEIKKGSLQRYHEVVIDKHAFCASLGVNAYICHIYERTAH